jgi:hypothetical protein
MGIFIVTFLGAAVVASLGLWSARIASAEAEAKKQRATHQSAEKRDKTADDRNQNNPDAMAMAGGTQTNKPDYDPGRYNGS